MSVYTFSDQNTMTKKQGGPENPKARRHTAHLFFRKFSGVGSNALRKTGARSLLRHRAAIHHSMLRQLRLDSASSYFC